MNSVGCGPTGSTTKCTTNAQFCCNGTAADGGPTYACEPAAMQNSCTGNAVYCLGSSECPSGNICCINAETTTTGLLSCVAGTTCPTSQILNAQSCTTNTECPTTDAGAGKCVTYSCSGGAVTIPGACQGTIGGGLAATLGCTPVVATDAGSGS